VRKKSFFRPTKKLKVVVAVMLLCINMALVIAVATTTALVAYRAVGVVVEAAMDHGFNDEELGLLLDDTNETNEFWDETLPTWSWTQFKQKIETGSILAS
jgi:hypothetical protein